MNTRTKPGRAALAAATTCMLALGACGHHAEGFDAVLLDDTSDEVLVTLADAVDRGELTVDDARAAQLLSPADGATVPADQPMTFSWQLPQTFKHGRATGEYVWLRIECSGMELPIDVTAIETVAYTPDEEHWAKMTASGGACTATLTTAFVDRGVIAEGGPFRPSQTPAFSLAQ